VTRTRLTQRQHILGTPVDPISLGDALCLVRAWHEQPDGLQHVVTVNPEFVMAARRDPAFARVLRASALATADGIGIVMAARLLGLPAAPRVTGVDLTEGVAGLAHESIRLFLLGASPGVANMAAAQLRERFPAVRIAGTWSGSPRDADFPEIERRIDAAGATVLLVAFGHPQQDLWIARHREALARRGILVAIGVGGTFDYLSGRVPRAPRWLRRVGLEWLYRLARQPSRWRRQLALPAFALLVLRERARRVTR
jgi:N-acetylglucosaminyldiphosphoundecaprenol N-acetyl-beta-D-mannosaminyltransferase